MEERRRKTFGIVLVILLLVAGVYGYMKWSSLHPAGVNNGMSGMGPPSRQTGGPGGPPPGGGGPPPNGQPGGDGPPPPPPGGPGGGPQQMFADLNLTSEQTKQLEEIRKNSGGNFQKMREETDKVLTSEQREKMREKMEKGRQEMDKRRAEMDARLKKALSEQDFAAFKKRMEQMRPPGPPPGGPPPGGGGPPPGP